MYSPNQLLLLAIATLLYAPYSEVAKISPPQRPVVKAKATATKQSTALKEVAVTATCSEAAVNDIPANTTSLDRRTLDRRVPRDEADLFRDGLPAIYAVSAAPAPIFGVWRMCVPCRWWTACVCPTSTTAAPPISPCQAGNSSCPTLSSQH